MAKEKTKNAKVKTKAKKVDGKAKVAKVVKSAKKIAQHPMAAEVVAATLVAAAAALRDPKEAKALALHLRASITTIWPWTVPSRRTTTSSRPRATSG